MDRIIKTNIIPGDHLKLYRSRKLESTQEYLNLLLFNDNNKFIINKQESENTPPISLISRNQLWEVRQEDKYIQDKKKEN